MSNLELRAGSRSLNCIFEQANRIVFREEDVPQPGPEEILCGAKVSLVSTGTELSCLRGRFDAGTVWESWVKYPFYPGYSMVAEVMEVGSAVEGVRAGDRIVCQAPHKQYFVLNAREAVIVPDSISDEQAAFLPISRVALLGVLRAEPALGERVGVIGLGLIGQLVIQFLNLCGTRQLIAIAPSSSRLQLALENGATDLLDMEAAAALEPIEELTGGKMLDTVYDVTGYHEVLQSCTRFTKDLGKVILLGDSTQPTKQSVGPKVVFNSVSILGIHGRMMAGFKEWTEPGMNAYIFDYMNRGKLNVERLISKKESPLKADLVYGQLADPQSGLMGVIFDWTQL